MSIVGATVGGIRKNSLIAAGSARFERWVLALQEYRVAYGKYPDFLYKMNRLNPASTIRVGQLSAWDEATLPTGFFAALAGKNPDGSESDFNPRGTVFYRFASDEYDRLNVNSVRMLDVASVDAPIYIAIQTGHSREMVLVPFEGADPIVVEAYIAIWSVPFERSGRYPKSWIGP